ncbi:MAG: thioredoxin [Leptospiraceae bacterium]|nr:thioredoxin [Leptospiraceae bacterium]MCP5511232.1 thioredoxin [Leptospiraceae bacterium]
MPININEENFKTEVVDVSFQKPVLIDFWAEWCGPCKMLSPLLDKLEKEYRGAFLLAKVDTDKNQQLAMMFRISSIPDVKLLRDGKIIDQFVGALPEKEIKKFLNKHVEVQEGGDPLEDLATQNPLEFIKKLKELKEEPENRDQLVWLAFTNHLLKSQKFEEAMGILNEIPDEGSSFSNQRIILEKFLKTGDPKTSIQKLSGLSNPKEKKEVLDYYLQKVESSPYEQRQEAKNDLLACFYFLPNEDEDLFLYRKKLSSLLF